MKFSVASSVAIIAAFAPSLVSAVNHTVLVGAGQDGQTGLVGCLIARAQLLSDPLQLTLLRNLTHSRSLRQRATSSASSSAMETMYVPVDIRERGICLILPVSDAQTVTQSSFANPCACQSTSLRSSHTPITNLTVTVTTISGTFNTATNKTGFNSGFIPFDPASRQVGVYSLEVSDPNTPIWFFCGRPPHCKRG